jgi:glycosyltransferase involved in cell wall biosynthesis
VLRTLAHLRAIGLLIRHRRRLSAVYFGGAGGLGIWYQLAVLAVARLAAVPAVFHHHSYAYLNRPQRSMRLLTQVGGARCTHVVLCTGMADALRAAYPAATSVRVCSNAGLLAAAEPMRQPRDDGPLVLGHLGNLVVEKGLPLVLDSLRKARAEGVEARLLLGGPVRSVEAEQLLAAARAEFGRALEHLGPVPPAEVDEFYRRLDLFVFPSTFVHEAEPLVVMEAARCGVPSVAFAVGCVPALVPRADLLVPVGDDFPAAAARAAVALRSATERDAARRAVVDHFTERRRAALDDQRDMVTLLTARRHGG